MGPILPWEKLLLSVFFISSGKNATSVQKQPKTFYEWDPLNYNISEFPKAVNRISCIAEEVLNTYIQTHRLFVSGSCSSEHAFFFTCVVSLSPENAVWLGGGVKIVPFDTVGLFIGLHPISLCGASAAVRPWRKNKVPMFLWQWTSFFTVFN